MDRNTILKQIETDIKEKLTVENGYEVQPVEVKRGVHTWESYKRVPALGLSWTLDEPFDENEHGEEIREMTIVFYMYAKTDGYGNTDTINNMVYDLQNFLKNTNHFTHSANTLIGAIECREGGLQEEKNAAWIQIRLIYDVSS